MTVKEKRNGLLINFIEANGLTFKGIGSELNSDCVIISGYALHIGVKKLGEIIDAVDAARPKHELHISDLSPVWKFAKDNNYGYNWNTPEYKGMYTY